MYSFFIIHSTYHHGLNYLNESRNGKKVIEFDFIIWCKKRKYKKYKLYTLHISICISVTIPISNFLNHEIKAFVVH